MYQTRERNIIEVERRMTQLQALAGFVAKASFDGLSVAAKNDLKVRDLVSLG